MADTTATTNRIVLLGLCHRDVFLDHRIPYCLDRLRPDIITYEQNKEECDYFKKETDEERASFHEMLRSSSLTVDQQRALITAFLSQDESIESIVVEKYAAEHHIPLFHIDEPNLEQNNFLIMYVKDHYSSMMRQLKEGFKPGSLLDDVLTMVKEKGLVAALQEKNMNYDLIYEGLALHFRGGNLSTKEEKDYQLGLASGHLGNLDKKISLKIRDVMVDGKRVVHIGGAGHFVDRPLTLYHNLREFEPKRFVIHPQWFDRMIESNLKSE